MTMDDSERLKFLEARFGWKPGDDLPKFDSPEDEVEFLDHVDVTELPGFEIVTDGEARKSLSGIEIVFTPEILIRMAKNRISMGEVVALLDQNKRTVERE